MYKKKINLFLITFFLLGLFAIIYYHKGNSLEKSTAKVKEWVTNIVNPKPDLQWTMVDVNSLHIQGDAHVIQIRGGKTILIDAGMKYPAEQVLVPFLKENHINKFDHVFISPVCVYFTSNRNLIKININFCK